MTKKFNIIVIFILISTIITPLYVAGGESNSKYNLETGVHYGGPRVEALGEQYYDPTIRFYQVKQKIDKNNNNIADDLEEFVKTKSDNDTIRVIITFSAKPVSLGGNQQALINGLNTIISILNNLGFKIESKIWKNAIVGFALELPAGSIDLLTSAIPEIDLDGDGIKDTFLISEDKEYYALNYWSSKQMGIRPYVWTNLGITGKGVTVVVIDTGIDSDNSAFPSGKIVFWADYTGDPNGDKRTEPYDDNMHGTHVAGTISGYYSSLDDQGRLVINFGVSDLDISESYAGQWLRFGGPYMAYYVNSTGVLEVDFKWKSDTTAADSGGAISKIGLSFCGNVTYDNCGLNVVTQMNTPDENTWYNLTYKITSSSQFGFYVVVFNVSQGGGLAFLPIMKVPVDSSDTSGVPYLAGMAPGAFLGGAKVLSYYGGGSTSDIISAIDDVVGNRTLVNPPLFIISMSLGGGYDSNLDQAISNAAQAGILAVVAAGNDGAGTGTAASGSPASNPYAITVAAIDALNNITDYSSDGGQSQSDSNVIKPDLAAPGGGIYLMIFSADTTWHDDLMNAVCALPVGNLCLSWSEDIDWTDAINANTEGFDDSIGISGTSMATPHISGLAALVVDALINVAGLNWDWNSFSTAGLVKNIIMISTYETYPLMREPNNSSYSPTLDKGGKDVHEGLGAVDAMAAVDLAISYGEGKAVLPGSVISATFRSGTAYNSDFSSGVWRWPWGRSVWASRVYLPVLSFKLSNGTTLSTEYVFKLIAATSDPSNTDFDLYVYDIHGNGYGEPVIVAKSVQGMGVTSETIQFTPDAQEYVLVAKRAREDSAGGIAYIIIGPSTGAEGYNDNGLSEDYAYIGNDVLIYGLSAYGAVSARIDVFDNTTGTLLSSFTVDTTQREGYSDFETSWIVPNDLGLDGHVLLFIVSFTDASGQVVEGPVYSALTVTGSPAPVPEAWWVSVIVVLALLVFILRYKF